MRPPRTWAFRRSVVLSTGQSHLHGLFACLCRTDPAGMWPDGRKGPSEVATEGSGLVPAPPMFLGHPASLPEVTTSQSPHSPPTLLGQQVLLRRSVPSLYFTNDKLGSWVLCGSPAPRSSGWRGHCPRHQATPSCPPARDSRGPVESTQRLSSYLGLPPPRRGHPLGTATWVPVGSHQCQPGVAAPVQKDDLFLTTSAGCSIPV